MAEKHQGFSEKGIAHLFLILAVAGVLGFLLSSNVPISRQYSEGRGVVQGVSSTASSEIKQEPNVVGIGHRDEKKFQEAKRRMEELRNKFGTEKIKVEYELEDGKAKIKAETEGEKVPDGALKELELEVEKSEVRVATAAGQMAVIHGKAGALSKFPLTLDLDTNSLVVTTPKGTKVVTVLPDAAIHNMLASKVMDDIKSASAGGYLASINQMVELKEKNGMMGYEIEGEKKHKLLGIFDFKSKVKAFVSAENGQVVETEQSIFGRILNRLAP